MRTGFQGTDDLGGSKLIRKSLNDRRKPISVWDETLSAFVVKLASVKSTPGGGAVAAVSACHAAALLKMVLEIAAKDGLEVKDQLSSVQAQLEALRQCVDEDIAAFDSFMVARKMPVLTEAESIRRHEVMVAALQRSTEAPLTGARAALKLVPLAIDLCDLTPARVLSDLGVALLQLDCGLAGFQFNVDINIRHDPAFEQLHAERDALAIEIASAHRDISSALRQVAEKIRR